MPVNYIFDDEASLKSGKLPFSLAHSSQRS